MQFFIAGVHIIRKQIRQMLDSAARADGVRRRRGAHCQTGNGIPYSDGGNTVGRHAERRSHRQRAYKGFVPRFIGIPGLVIYIQILLECLACGDYALHHLADASHFLK